MEKHKISFGLSHTGLETCELPGWSIKKIIPNWLTSGCSKVMAVAV